MTEIKSIGQNYGSLTHKVVSRAEEALGPKTITPAFNERMGDAIRDVADAQKNSADLAKAYELGLESDLSKVMVARQVSSLGFQMVLNVRNKVLSAYKDIMNMPV